MVCPYCGASWDVESENYNDYIDIEEIEECSECGMMFTASAEVTVTFTTRPVEDIAKYESRYMREQGWLDYNAAYIKTCQDKGINMDSHTKGKRKLIDALEHNEKVGKFPKDEDEEDEWEAKG